MFWISTTPIYKTVYFLFVNAIKKSLNYLFLMTFVEVYLYLMPSVLFECNSEYDPRLHGSSVYGWLSIL